MPASPRPAWAPRRPAPLNDRTLPASRPRADRPAALHLKGFHRHGLVQLLSGSSRRSCFRIHVVGALVLAAPDRPHYLCAKARSGVPNPRSQVRPARLRLRLPTRRRPPDGRNSALRPRRWRGAVHQPPTPSPPPVRHPPPRTAANLSVLVVVAATSRLWALADAASDGRLSLKVRSSSPRSPFRQSHRVSVAQLGPRWRRGPRRRRLRLRARWPRGHAIVWSSGATASPPTNPPRPHLRLPHGGGALSRRPGPPIPPAPPRIAPDGDGKTTLAKLPAPLRPQSGSIEVDGIDLREFDVDLAFRLTALSRITSASKPLRDNVAPWPDDDTCARR